MKLTLPGLTCLLALLVGCGPATSPQTRDFVLKASDVPANLPLPTLEWELMGNTFSDQAGIVEEHTSATGQQFVVYGFATSISDPSGNADLALYYKGRKGGNDEWVLRWSFNGTQGEMNFNYVPGTVDHPVDTDQFKVTVR